MCAMNPRLLRPLASGFNPKSIAGLQLWLDAADASTLTIDSGVSVWADKSGGGYNATQSTGLNQPDLISSGLNGKPVVRFDGVNHFLGGSTLPALGTSPFTFFLVGKSSDSVSSKYMAIIGVFGSGSGILFTAERAIRTGNGNRIWGDPFTTANVGSYVATGNSHSDLFAWDNGQQLTPITTANNVNAYTITSNSYGLGAAFVGSSHIACDIAEVLFFPRALAATERQKVEGYLAWKWGLEAQLPSNHPYAYSFPGFGSQPRPSNADALDWESAVYANSGSVSVGTLAAVNTFANAIDAAGIRDRFYRLNLFAGTGLNAALVPLYRGPTYGGAQYGNTTDTNNGPFVSGDYSESVGLTSDSSSKFLRTGMNMSDLDTVETGHMSVCYGGLVSAQENLLGATSAAPLDRYTIQFNNATATLGNWGSNTAAQATGGSAVSADGMATITRRSATDLEYYENATSKATSAVSVTPAVDGIEVYIFRTNSSTASFPAYTDRIRGYSIGRSVTSGQVADFYAAMKTFQDALGRTQT